MEVLAQRLAALRAERGESYERIAAQVGVTMKIVKKWERGEGRPSAENLLRLVRFYDVSADYLLGDTDDPRRRRRPKAEPAAVAPAESGDSTQMREAGDEAAVLGDRRRANRRSTRSQSAPMRPAGSEGGR